jgi:hypothetical protein
MERPELISGPGDLLILALVAGVAGTLIFVVANLILKASGIDVNEHARRTERYRNMGYFEQMNAMHSDSRNIPGTMSAYGLFLVLGAVLMALVAGVWFLIRVVSG